MVSIRKFLIPAAVGLSLAAAALAPGAQASTPKPVLSNPSVTLFKSGSVAVSINSTQTGTTTMCVPGCHSAPWRGGSYSGTPGKPTSVMLNNYQYQYSGAGKVKGGQSYTFSVTVAGAGGTTKATYTVKVVAVPFN